MADAHKLESAPPPVHTKFEAFHLLLSRFTYFLLKALGPDCNLYLKSNKFILALTLPVAPTHCPQSQIHDTESAIHHMGNHRSKSSTFMW
jgi:hypothetical protein